jgi:hypothetical protein
MLAEHLGIGHEIVSSENIIHASIIKSDTHKCIGKVEE